MNSYETKIYAEGNSQEINEYNENHNSLNELISGASLVFTNVRLTNLVENNFVVTLSVINAESCRLEMTFLNDIQVSFNSKTIGKMSLKHKTIKIIPQKNIQLEMEFTPLDDFNSFSRALFTNEQLYWDLEGNTSVKLMSLNPMEVKLLKHIKFDDSEFRSVPNLFLLFVPKCVIIPSIVLVCIGMNILTIDNIDAPSDHPDGGITIIMNIINSSHVRVELDNMPFDIKYMNQTVGKISSTRFSNDRNTLSFSGCLLQPNTKEKLDVMTDVFFKILSGKELQLTFNARECLVSWLDRISLTVNITEETKINFNYELIKCAWGLKFDPKDQYAPKVSLHCGIKYLNIFSLGICKFSCECDLIYKELQLATFNIPYTTIFDSSGIIESRFTTKLRLFSEESKDLFSEIAKKMYQEEDFALVVKGKINVMAKTPVDDFKMECESKDIIVSLKYLPNKDDGDFIKNYLNGVGSLLFIKANNKTTSISLLQKAFETIELEVILPGLDVPFINEAEVSFTSKDSFKLNNPLKTRLHLFGFNAKVFNMNNEHIATATKKYSNNGIVVEAGKTEKIQVESSKVDIINAIQNIKDCAYGVKENLECVLMFGIGEDENDFFRINLNYSKSFIL
ncbi:23533_t:CDS:2 [Cetraspora pellucida]|uniref:23533_t:CDS:1 n=1 Tax=Cetraspora pellucida TaxID=1433469 RepID=A0A9N9F7H4_9GLOM|nr:23533_t:CDS:2 [Cetraspora pellucida]